MIKILLETKAIGAYFELCRGLHETCVVKPNNIRKKTTPDNICIINCIYFQFRLAKMRFKTDTLEPLCDWMMITQPLSDWLKSLSV